MTCILVHDQTITDKLKMYTIEPEFDLKVLGA